ncbi:MAG: hypothetical protein LUC91_07185 [Prevotella sp.]|nr:hypothetical protein [Prevotella sp.]
MDKDIITEEVGAEYINNSVIAHELLGTVWRMFFECNSMIFSSVFPIVS